MREGFGDEERGEGRGCRLLGVVDVMSLLIRGC